MQIARQLQEISLDLSQGSCVTIGNFDGVHNGHRKLIARMMSKAASAHLAGIVVTFDPHPLRVLAKEHAPVFITDHEKKLDLLAALGVDLTLTLEFTHALAAMEPEDFIHDILVAGLHLKELVVGYDYSFGKERKGHFALLTKLGEKYGFSCERLEPVIIDGAIVSSTRIRDMLTAGDVWGVRTLLDRFYVIRGTVVRGMNRGGALLGFPTANLQVRDELLPAPGVYAVWVEVEGSTYKGVTNIGCNPTFGEQALSVETHIVDFDRDIYHCELRLSFVHRLRDERAFANVSDLVLQIHNDVALGKQILASQESQM